MSEYLLVPTESIASGNNVRILPAVDDEERDLARSVRERGLLQPLIVRRRPDDGYLLVAGHRRYRAALAVGLAEVPVIVEPDDEDAAITQLIENTQRADMHPMDVARAVVALLDRQPEMTQEALARKLGRSPSYVSDALKKCRRDPVIQRDIVRGRIGGRAASLMSNRSATERDQLVSLAERPGTLQKVMTAPSTKSMTIVGQGGRMVHLTRENDIARVELVGPDGEGGSSIRLDLAQARRLARGLRLLCDALEQVWVKSA